MAGNCDGANNANGGNGAANFAAQNAMGAGGTPPSAAQFQQALSQFSAAMNNAVAAYGAGRSGQQGYNAQPYGAGYGAQRYGGAGNSVQGMYGQQDLRSMYGPQAAQGAQGARGAQGGQGTALLNQGLQNGTVRFDGQGARNTYGMVADLLNRDPVMRQDFSNALQNGSTFSIGTRNSGNPSFSTLGTQNIRIEFNTQDAQRAPNGGREVIAHELTHAIGGLSLDDNRNHSQAFYAQVDASLQRAGYIQ
jgi:hypothetical protein